MATFWYTMVGQGYFVSQNAIFYPKIYNMYTKIES